MKKSINITGASAAVGPYSHAVKANGFTEELPARSCVEVAKLPKGGLVEIELIAVEKE